MIYDNIRNINLYKGMSQALDTGLAYIFDVNNDVENGVVLLENGVKAFISEYTTKKENENGYEAHRHFIDIQYPLFGLEMVKYCPLEFLTPSSEYNKEKDYILFSNHEGFNLTIGNGYFLILFPEDCHMPQLCVNNPQKIKKLTLKIPVK